MAITRGGTSMSHMNDDDGSEDEVLMPTPESARENVAPGKKKIGKTKGSAGKIGKPTIPRRKATRVSMAGVRKDKKPRPKRTALAERINMQDAGNDTEDVDDIVQEPGKRIPQQTIEENISAPVPKEPAKRGRRPKQKADNAIAALEHKTVATEVQSTQQETPEAVRKSKFANKSSSTQKPKIAKRAPSPTDDAKNTIPETQPDSMDLEPTGVPGEGACDELGPQPRQRQAHKERPTSRQRPVSVMGRRGGSASDTERNTGSDPLLRRKLGEMTKKFEALQMKYQNLQDTGIEDAKSNMEKLQRRAEEKTREAEALISSLRAQIKTQTALASESKSLRIQVSALTAQNDTLTFENKSLTSSLTQISSQNQTLSAKLAASRNATIAGTSDAVTATNTVKNMSSSKGPGSAAKAKTTMVGSAEAAKDAVVRQLKEDLYSDLTGLIIRGVKREDDADVYDCLQTGRNGTLHFHLTLTSPSTSAPSSSQATSYDDAEFAYTPLLDQNRDKELLDILPDYLTEEICFPRSSAGRFYARVVDCLVKRQDVVEEQEEE